MLCQGQDSNSIYRATNQTMAQLCKIGVICLIATLAYSMPSNMGLSECTKRGDCGPSSCCVIGMHRFSVPSCQPKGQVGDYCLVSNESHNLTLTFPNDLSIRVTDVHTLFCPCASDRGLICRRGRCVHVDDDDFTNTI